MLKRNTGRSAVLRRSLIIVLSAVVLSASIFTLGACNKDTFPDGDYIIVANLVASLFWDGYCLPLRECEVEGDILDIRIEVSRDKDDVGHIIVDRDSGDIRDVYLESGLPLNEYAVSYSDYPADAVGGADAGLKETQEKFGYVRFGFVEPMIPEDFLVKYYTEDMWTPLCFAALGGSADGGYAAGYWFSRGYYHDPKNYDDYGDIGINIERMLQYKPTNLRKQFMPAERFEEIASWMCTPLSERSELRQFAAELIKRLTGDDETSLTYASYHYSRIGERCTVLGFSVATGRKELPLRLLEQDDNLYVVEWH